MTLRKTPSPQTIAIDLQEVDELFNAMDPTPFPVKDLDADVEEFILSWAREYPERTPLRLVVHLHEGAEDDAATETITKAVHHYFAYRANLSRREFGQLMKRGRTSLVVGLVFMTSCLALSELIARAWQHPIALVAREGLVIGGWVAMWRPLEILLYDWWPLRRARRIFEKLAAVDVSVERTPTHDERNEPHGKPQEDLAARQPAPGYRRARAAS